MFHVEHCWGATKQMKQEKDPEGLATQKEQKKD